MVSKVKTYFLSIGLFFFIFQNLYCQNQQKADSIKNLYKSGNYKIPEFIQLYRITEFEANQDSALFYANVLIEKALTVKPKDSSLKAFRLGYLAKGNALLIKGDNSKAIESFIDGLKYAEQVKDQHAMAYLQISIASTYAAMENNEFAEKHYIKGIELLRKIPDSINLASALLNAGDWSINNQKYEEALKYFKESIFIFKKNKNIIGIAYNLGNIGMVYAKQDKDELAEKNINKAIGILEELEDYYPISVYLTYLSDIYVEKGNFDFALKYANRSLKLAEAYGLKEQISEASLKLSELYENSDNKDLALFYYKNHVIYRDSVHNITEVQKISNATNSKTLAELALESQKRKTERIALWSILGVLFLIGLLAYSLFRRNKFIRATNEIIAAEKNRTDKLLLNILPEDTANELKVNGKVKAKQHESVSVLFTDFKGFTSYSENLSPEALVETVDFYFSKFDAIIEKHGLEKIKTIGDAYMCAGGLHKNENGHAKSTVAAAFEIAEFVENTKNDIAASDLAFDIRIGINTGSVVAGVVGTKKFAYDICGDTVNVASRMESMSIPGKINISEYTYAMVKEDYTCEYRGEIEVKNRGFMKMYFVNA